MKVLVIGASGMAGHVIATYLIENGYIVDTIAGKRDFNSKTIHLNISDTEALNDFLGKEDYKAVINCAGMLVQASEDNKCQAIQINSLLPHVLEEFYKNTKTKVIHLSTDCVFSGKNGPYSEASTPDGELFYDKTKMLGEIINDKDLTFRMSIIGPDMQKDGIGLFNWFSQQSGEIYGYKHAIWNGITTIRLAAAIDTAIKENLTGLYQLVPNEKISKHDLLHLFKNTFEVKDIVIKQDNRPAPDKTLINTRIDFNFTLPSYKDMLTEMKDWIINHKQLYKHYERII